MSIEKAQLKMAVAHEIGARIDDVLEAAVVMETRLSGAPDWIRKSAQAVLAMHAEVDKDVDGGKCDLEQAKVLKDLITKAAGRVQSVLAVAESEQRIAAGKVVGLKLAVEVTKRVHTEEELKAAKIQEEVTADGAHRPPLKARRLAEGAPKKKAARRAKNT